MYIRQKPCQYAASGGGVSTAHHQHIRRYMIPRDAAAIATKSMAMLEQAGNGRSVGLQPGTVSLRPHTAIGTSRQQARAQNDDMRQRVKSAKGAL